MNILCTDKTGTLTEDKIELVKYLDIDGNDSPSVLKMTYLNSKMQTGISNPLDQAVLNFRKIDIEGYQKIDEIPFDFTGVVRGVHGEGESIKSPIEGVRTFLLHGDCVVVLLFAVDNIPVDRGLRGGGRVGGVVGLSGRI